MRILFVLALLTIIGCQKEKSSALESDDNATQSSINDWSDNPWPAIRTERINTLLPDALNEAGVDAWLVICRENNNDPLADHIGGQNAGGEAAFLFFNAPNGFRSMVFSPSGEATALADLKIHDTVIAVKRGKSAILQAVDFINSAEIETLALNFSQTNNVADGLSYTQYEKIKSRIDSALKLVSSTGLVYNWLSIKLPQEVAIMREAAQLTSDWQYEVYNKVQPGKTTDADVAAMLKDKMKAHGVKDGWAPDQNPNVNSGADRGHSHATDKIIRPGDVIQIDFGIKLYDRWVSDIQRFAYVLRAGENKAPDSLQAYWEAAKAGSRAALAAMKPGVKGVDVDKAQRVVMEKAGSEYVMWSTGHPVGYVAHDVGPNLGGSQSSHVRPASEKLLKEGMTFAYDGFYAWKLNAEEVKTISVEEMVVITADGAEYLIAPQEELILID